MTIVEGPEELIIRVRWIPRARGVIMLVVLFPFLAFVVWVNAFKTPFIVLSVVLTYPGLLIALNEYRLTVHAGRVVVSSGPIPIFWGRRSLETADIRDVFWSKLRTTGGRGVVERYPLQVRTTKGPVVLLDAECESDTVAAAEALKRWLKSDSSVRR